MAQNRRVIIKYYNQEYSIACDQCKSSYACNNGSSCIVARYLKNSTLFVTRTEKYKNGNRIIYAQHYDQSRGQAICEFATLFYKRQTR